MVGYHISMKELRKCLLWKAPGKDINFPMGFKEFVLCKPPRAITLLSILCCVWQHII